MSITVKELVDKLLAYHPDTEVRILSGYRVVTEPIEDVVEQVACKELGQKIGVEVVIQALDYSPRIASTPLQPLLSHN